MARYPRFRSLAEARLAFRRKRKTQSFVLEGNGTRARCHCCGRPLSEPVEADIGGAVAGNRCTYSPKTKQFRLRHYLCAWTDLLDKAVDLGRRMA